MWELVSYMLAIAAVLFIVNYLMVPGQLIEDIKSLKSSSTKIDELERRIEELEKAQKTEAKSKA